MIAAGEETGRRLRAAFGAAGWLGLAAAPTFAVMAIFTYASGNSADMMCPAMREISPLGGMAAMYALMSVFHAPPWLKLARRG